MSNTVTSTRRVLPESPYRTLDEYLHAGGGGGFDAALRLGRDGIVEQITAAGLRGRGGAGFPTGTKWSTVRRYASGTVAPTVVVNGAEGEPGSFKDRMLLRRNPYAVLEGARIAAIAVGADRIVVAVKRSSAPEIAALQRAVDELRRAGWFEGIDVFVFEGPSEYLFGEETALLEAIDGRPPFPRIQPPYRYGVEEVSDDRSGEPAQVVMASGGTTIAPPTLVNNVETMANVPGILAHGPAWFREVGTDESPGSIVCTITGATARHGVAEIPMGTLLADAIDAIGGGARPGRTIVAAISGVANAIVPRDALATPLTYEAMQAIGSGLGAAGFIVFDDTSDMAAVAHGIARFLSVESCGQCLPCKTDGLALRDLFQHVRRSDASDSDLDAIDDHLRTVADSARCFLAQQQQIVLGSIVVAFPDALRAHVDGRTGPAADVLVAEITDIADGHATLDESHFAKQPDWTFEPTDSGKTPAARLAAPHHDEGSVVPHLEAPEPTPEPRRERAHEHEVVQHVHGTPVDEVDYDDPELKLYTSEPVETDEGTVVIQQQNVGPRNEEGGGEWPDPHTAPQAPAPGAFEPDATDERT